MGRVLSLVTPVAVHCLFPLYVPPGIVFAIIPGFQSVARGIRADVSTRGGYTVFNVLVVAACLSFLSPFVLFLVLRSPLFFPLFLSIVYAQKMYMSIGDCIKRTQKWENLDCIKE